MGFLTYQGIEEIEVGIMYHENRDYFAYLFICLLLIPLRKID